MLPQHATQITQPRQHSHDTLCRLQPCLHSHITALHSCTLLATTPLSADTSLTAPLPLQPSSHPATATSPTRRLPVPSPAVTGPEWKQAFGDQELAERLYRDPLMVMSSPRLAPMMSVLTMTAETYENLEQCTPPFLVCCCAALW
jgi:hypothetical protein